MTKNELDHIINSIHNLSDSIEGSAKLPEEINEKIVSLVNAANQLSKKLEIHNPSIRSKAERMEEIQDVLNAYLRRDFSKTNQLSDAKDNIDAIALSINYFGQDLQESFQQIKVQEEVLKKKNKEILILLKEVNHRVKNNFQIISSLISMQMRSLKDPTLSVYFNNIKNRIYSMAQAHEMLHKTKNISSVNCQQYILDISNNIVSSFNNIETQISLNVEIQEDLFIKLDAFTTIGLLINEIVTNSVKHAFTNMKKGDVNIKLVRFSKEKYELTISDNGHGTSFSAKESDNSIGLTIIDALVEQLEGKCIRESLPKGTMYNIRFDSFNESVFRELQE